MFFIVAQKYGKFASIANLPHFLWDY